MKKLFSLALTFTLCSGAVFAQVNPVTSFKDVDRDNNNSVSLDEAQSRVAGITMQMFNNADSDHDGKLGQDEFAIALRLVEKARAAGKL